MKRRKQKLIDEKIADIIVSVLFRFDLNRVKKLAVILLIIGLNWTGLSAIGHTVSFYNDTETASGNVQTAGQLDFILEQSAWTPSGGELDLDAGESVLQEITIDDVDDKSIDFKYIAWSEMTGGDADFCNVLELEAFLEGTPQYTGLLFDFISATTTFATTTDTWRFDVSFPIDAPEFDGAVCEFDFVYSGWQLQFPNEGEGFNDVERASNTIESHAGQCSSSGLIDFEADDAETAILAGQVIDDEYSAWGLNINATNNKSGHPNIAIAFDSSDPTGDDYDLGTPNEDFGGPGVGVGGEIGEPGENAVAQGNLLIIAENNVDVNGDGLIDDPDDEANGGYLIFTFDEETYVESVRLIDIDEPGVKIKLYNDENINFSTINIADLENNSAQTINIDTDGVKKMKIKLTHSGGVDDVCFTKIADEYDEYYEYEPNVVLNEFLPNPGGFEYGFDFGEDHDDMPQGEWVELYNNSDADVDVTGWYLRDSTPGEGNKTPINAEHILAALPVVPAHGWFVVYMNKPIYNNTGDTVRLFDDSDNLIDSYTYTGDPDYCEIEPTPGEENSAITTGDCGGVPPNKSYARIPDGIGAWVDPIPTPLAPNKADEEATDSMNALIDIADEKIIIEEAILTEEMILREETTEPEKAGGWEPDDDTDGEIIIASAEESVENASSTPEMIVEAAEILAESVGEEPVDDDTTVESTEAEGEFPVIEAETQEVVQLTVVEEDDEEEPAVQIVIEPEIVLEEAIEELPVIEAEAPEVVKLAVVEENPSVDTEEDIIIELIVDEPIIETEPEILQDSIEEVVEE